MPSLLLQDTSRWRARDLRCLEVPYSPNLTFKEWGSFLSAPQDQPHHHLDVPIINGDTADVGGGLPVGDAFLVQLTAAQDEAWRKLHSSRDCSPRSSGVPPTILGQECSV